MTAQAPPNIDQLQELALPTPPFSYAPQTWGWLLLLLVVVVLLSCWGISYWRRWQRNRYRREALVYLDGLEHNLTDTSQRLQALRELPVLLKRVALSMNAAAPAASLSAGQWQGFLAQHAPAPLAQDFAAHLYTLAYAPDHLVLGIPQTEINALFATSRQWIEAHHVAV
ncbi:DUF4381 domain-containing protein [Pseudomonas sp. UM16]|uniref:DUF4381 domain-containing protein n=1 Tax=Pseudomonas sp. UM16 TaxID=3158962 RepID=UPI0039902B4E